MLLVKVTPNASKNEIQGWEEGRLRIKIQEIPDRGKANAALITYLAKLLKIPKKNILLVSGETSRLKRLKIEGINESELREKILTS